LDAEGAKRAILEEARRAGFDRVGVAPAHVPPEESERLAAWLADGMHGTMEWMKSRAPLRTDPSRLLPGARSVVVAAAEYESAEPGAPAGRARISRYALGRDYHEVLRAMLRKVESAARELLAGAKTRSFVDSAPVLEKMYAQRAGIGWRGKHSNVIVPGGGSWFFLGGFLIDHELPADAPSTDRCGSCRACIDACPTGAIVRPYVVDGSRCISYLTIEHRGAVDDELARGSGEWVFGCDICQEVCPWNRFARGTRLPDLKARRDVAGLTLERARTLGRAGFERMFRGTPVLRAGWERFRESVERAIRNREREVE